MKHFSFQLKDDSVVRAMNRQQYKAHVHWLRMAARVVDGMVDWEKVHRKVCDAMLYGCTEFDYKDVLI